MLAIGNAAQRESPLVVGVDGAVVVFVLDGGVVGDASLADFDDDLGIHQRVLGTGLADDAFEIEHAPFALGDGGVFDGDFLDDFLQREGALVVNGDRATLAALLNDAVAVGAVGRHAEGRRHELEVGRRSHGGKGQRVGDGVVARFFDDVDAAHATFVVDDDAQDDVAGTTGEAGVVGVDRVVAGDELGWRRKLGCRQRRRRRVDDSLLGFQLGQRR